MIEKTALPKGCVLKERYEISALLGKGGFGITYLAFDKVLQQKVAVKEFFPTELVSRDCDTNGYIVTTPEDNQERALYEKGMQRFLKEARNLNQFQDTPGIVGVFDFFYENQTAYMVMEYVEGISLKDYLDNLEEPLTAEQVFQMMRPVMDSLGFMHGKNIIHRDLSPDNIMVDSRGNLKIVDFGAARQFLNDGVRTMTVILKSGFAPPEQYLSKGKQGPWTDIYALCATMYYMLTGIVPPNALERKKLDELFEISAYGIEISPEQEQVIQRGLSLNVQERFQKMADLKAAIYGNTEQCEEENQPRKWKRRILAAALLILAAGVVCFVWMNQQNKKRIPDKVTLTGNYYRGSDVYKEFMDFVEKNALNETEEKGEICYELSEDSVREWGAPCNLSHVNMDYTEVVSYIEEHFPERKELKDKAKTINEVTVKKYGEIDTFFAKRVCYELRENVDFLIQYDYMDGRILNVRMESEMDDELALEEFWKLGCFMALEDGADLGGKDWSNWREWLEEYKEKESSGCVMGSDKAVMTFGKSPEGKRQQFIYRQPPVTSFYW